MASIIAAAACDFFVIEKTDYKATIQAIREGSCVDAGRKLKSAR
jgi:hypothetical protein